MLTTTHSQIETQHFRPALALIDTLLKELKRLDDKMILTEVHLLESRVNHATKNYAKAKVRVLLAFSLVCASADSPHHLVGRSYIRKNRSCSHLLPSLVASSAGYAVWYLAHGRQGLQDRVSLQVLFACSEYELNYSANRYSYFFETFEGFSGQDDDRALPALKNMCLCKIMMSLVSRTDRSYTSPES